MIEFYFKQAIIFRSDLKIGKGKIAAQAGHAAVSAAEKARIHNTPIKWRILNAAPALIPHRSLSTNPSLCGNPLS